MFVVTVFLPGAMTEAVRFSFETLKHVAIHFDMSYSVVCNLWKGRYNSDASRYMSIRKEYVSPQEKIEHQRMRKRINSKVYRDKVRDGLVLWEKQQREKQLKSKNDGCGEEQKDSIDSPALGYEEGVEQGGQAVVRTAEAEHQEGVQAVEAQEVEPEPDTTGL